MCMNHCRVVVLLLLLLMSFSVQGAVIVVNSTDQEVPSNDASYGIKNGNCTLSEAIHAAMYNVPNDACIAGDGDDTIQLAANSAYVLNQIFSDNNGSPVGLRVISNPKATSNKLTIDGQGATIMRDMTAPNFRIMRIFGSDDVVIKNLIIRNGKLLGDYKMGGGIVVENTNLVLDHVTMESNMSGAGGAALAVQATKAGFTVTILDSIFKSNTGGSAVDVTPYGTVIIKNSSFKSNAGVALSLNVDAVDIQDTLFSQNVNQYAGGGAYISATSSKILRCAFIGNQASSGGGLLNMGNLTISQSLFKDNKALSTDDESSNHGGGAIDNGSEGTLTLINSTLTGNHANGVGGAILSAGQGTYIINSTIVKNSADLVGGGIEIANQTASPVISNSIVYNNTPQDCKVYNIGSVVSGGYNVITDAGGCPKIVGDVVVKLTDMVLADFEDSSTVGFGHFPLLPASVTVNKGNKCVGCPENDQIGTLRNNVNDIGAIEARCGDGYVHELLGEECDQKNYLNGDGCNSTCNVEAGWSCSGSPSVCQPSCGNGVLDAGEQCDDGDVISGNGCSSSCTVEDGYSCFIIAPDTKSSCFQSCGNGQKDGGTEECDDANKVSGDGCSAKCKIESGYSCNGIPSVCKGTCGNGKVELGEQCDDNNKSNSDGCSDNCAIEKQYQCAGEPSVCSPVCGDGMTVEGVEACDDGNKANGDGCSEACKVEKYYFCNNFLDYKPSSCFEWCGDGVKFGAEECDDGNYDNGDGCTSQCKKEGCGNGKAEAVLNEVCDGADLSAKDCTNINMGFDGGVLSCNGDCTFNTAQCTAVIKESCGDGVKNGIELCDKEDLGGKTCTALGLEFESGKISCNPDCTINVSECVKPKITVAGGTVTTTGGEGSASGGSTGSAATTPPVSAAPAPESAAPAASGGSGGGCSLIR